MTPTLERAMIRICAVVAVAATVAAPPLGAQMPTPRPEDVATIDGIIRAFWCATGSSSGSYTV
jgi:hypothetical protein